MRSRSAAPSVMEGAPVRIPGPRMLMFLTVCIGGGSLVLFAYFLIFGAPLTVSIARSEPALLAWDALLCLVFFLQHSGMIRRGVKDRITRRIPAACYPALYSIASGVALIALVLLWQPSDRFLFRLGDAWRWLSACLALAAVVGFVWGVRSLRWFDPFGRLALEASLRDASPPPAAFVAEGAYRIVRHPLYLFMLVLIWSTPRFSTDQLLFNLLWTLWVVVGTKLEERDLVAEFGESYRRYQHSVPMLIPSPRPLGRRA
jgi:methanethiol S-methyltransferase